MIHEIHIPQQGVTSDTVKIVKWEAVEGQQVKADQVLVILETDKATCELNAPADGYLRIVQPEGSTHPMGAVIGVLGDTLAEVEGVSPPIRPVADSAVTQAVTPAADSGTMPPSIPGRGPIKIAGIARKLAEKHGIDPADIPGTGPAGRITKVDVEKAIDQKRAAAVANPALAPATGSTPLKISGVARSLAQKHALDLIGVAGTGPGGKITLQDVQNVLGIQPEPTSAPKPAPPSSKPGIPRVKNSLPFSGKVRVMADRLIESMRAMAPMTHWEEVDMTQLIELRSWANQNLVERDNRLSFGDLFIKFTALAVKEYPLLNCTIQGEEIKIWDEINIGMAVAVGEDLVVPIIHDAGDKTVLEISRAMKAIVARARENRLAPEDISGGTITITNIGAFGANPGTPIIHLPETAIVGFGRIEKKPVVRNEEVVVRPMSLMSVTVDHRVITGAVAARFRLRLKEILEDPKKMLLKMV
jgi:pyruvate dehydrogenase E2 component (dihydrolipoamide acetyltransferase)